MARGNWDTIFRLGCDLPEDRHEWAMLGIKAELVYNGIPQGGMEMDNPEFGVGTRSKVIAFQKSKGLTPDGEVGPITAHELFKKRILAAEKQYRIEPGLLCKNQKLESGNDPASLSPDGEDRGLQQINRRWHPEVTDRMAWDPEFAIGYGARYLANAYAIFRKEFPAASEEFVWDLALASYNVGTGPARTWGKAGRPQFGADGKVITAWQYVMVVRRQKC